MPINDRPHLRFTADQHQQSRFRYGWRFDTFDTNLHTTATAGVDVYRNSTTGIKLGDRVYITLPGGEQHIFAFEP